MNFMRKIIDLGTDPKGNPIQYIDNLDGTWSCLYDETVWPESHMRRHFPWAFAEVFAYPISCPPQVEVER